MRKFGYLAVGAAALALSVGTANAAPKTNMLHQWAVGADAAAIAKLGEMYTAAGGVWEQTAIAGHTANTLAKLRADVVAGNAPPAVQLKGPEIAEWNATGGTANLDELAAAEGWDTVVAPELLPVMKPDGHWVAAPMNIHRINWLWAQQEGAERRRHHRAAEDLGRVQRRLREDRRDRQDLHGASQRRLERRHALRSDRLRPGHRPLPQGVRRGRPRCAAQRGHDQGLRRAPPDGLEVHGSGDRRPRLRFRLGDARRTARPASSSWATGRSARSPPPASSRTKTTSAARRRPTGASRASS